MLVCISNITMNRELLAKAKRLEEIEELKKVFITPDLDEEKRKKGKALWEELKEWRDKSTHNLIIHKVKMVVH